MRYYNIVILGGSGGIGKAIIQVLIQSHINIINIDKHSANINSKYYTEILRDLKPENVNEVCQIISERFKSIDGFISVIGYYGVNTLDTFSYEEYMNTLNINVSIPTLFGIYLLKKMKEENKGKMIFVSSAAAYIGSRDISYSISKSAILGLVKGLSKSLAGLNIYIYGVAPGIVKTSMSKNMSVSRQNDAIMNTINKRMCKPIEIAKLVRFILIEDDGYMNGTIVHINDGLYLN